MSYIVEHSRGKKQLVVTLDYTASKWGSGLMDILATPAMIALAEATCMESVQGDLEKGMTTVGTKIDIEHLSPTPLGMTVTCKSELIEIDRRRLVFKVELFDDKGIIGKGLHERFIVNAEAFQQKANAKNEE
jgi:fluoroacetyl-CoA thioesterase